MIFVYPMFHVIVYYIIHITQSMLCFRNRVHIIWCGGGFTVGTGSNLAQVCMSEGDLSCLTPELAASLRSAAEHTTFSCNGCIDLSCSQVPKTIPNPRRIVRVQGAQHPLSFREYLTLAPRPGMIQTIRCT